MSDKARDFLAVLEDFDGVGVFVRRDQPTGTWIFCVIHDDTLGPATGGCRMKVYDHPVDGLVDALRLAQGMTNKWAAMDFPFGGGKTVLAIPRPLNQEERRALLHRFGALLNSLGGRYGTGADFGTTTEDMQTIAEVSEYVIGVHGRTDGPMDPSPYTALGVLEGIRSAVRHKFESTDLGGRRILVQGVGSVGAVLATDLAAEGAHLLISDIDEARARALAERLSGEFVPTGEVYSTPCDVYAPCAIGATLGPDTIPLLECAIVAGAANNQLQTPADADALHKRGILYAPDYVINGGGAMAFTLIYQGIDDLGELDRRVRAIGISLEGIFTEAAMTARSPVVSAQALADRVLARGPK